MRWRAATLWGPCPPRRDPAVDMAGTRDCAQGQARVRQRVVSWRRSWRRWCCGRRMHVVYGQSRPEHGPPTGGHHGPGGVFHWLDGWQCGRCGRQRPAAYNWRPGPLR